MENTDYIEINSDEIDLLRIMLDPPKNLTSIPIKPVVVEALIEKGFLTDDGDNGIFVNEFGEMLVAQHEAWINGEPSRLVEVSKIEEV